MTKPENAALTKRQWEVIVGLKIDPLAAWALEARETLREVPCTCGAGESDEETVRELGPIVHSPECLREHARLLASDRSEP